MSKIIELLKRKLEISKRLYDIMKYTYCIPLSKEELNRIGSILPYEGLLLRSELNTIDAELELLREEENHHLIKMVSYPQPLTKNELYEKYPELKRDSSRSDISNNKISKTWNVKPLIHGETENKTKGVLHPLERDCTICNPPNKVEPHNCQDGQECVILGEHDSPCVPRRNVIPTIGNHLSKQGIGADYPSEQCKVCVGCNYPNGHLGHCKDREGNNLRML